MSLGNGIHHKKQMLNLCARFPLKTLKAKAFLLIPQRNKRNSITLLLLVTLNCFDSTA